MYSILKKKKEKEKRVACDVRWWAPLRGKQATGTEPSTSDRTGPERMGAIARRRGPVAHCACVVRRAVRRWSVSGLRDGDGGVEGELVLFTRDSGTCWPLNVSDGDGEADSTGTAGRLASVGGSATCTYAAESLHAWCSPSRRCHITARNLARQTAIRTLHAAPKKELF